MDETKRQMHLAASCRQSDLAAQKNICEQMHVLAFEEVPFVPTGQSFSPAAFRSNLSGIAKSPYPVFWGVKRA